MAEELIPADVRQNRSKMNSLYSSIRSELINPDDKISKVSFWKKVIRAYCREKSEFTITLTLLKVKFHLDGRSPQCLEDVLQDMLQNEECVPLCQYLEESPVSWPAWFTHTLIKKPVSLLFTKLKDLVYGVNLNNTFIHLEMLSAESDRLLSVVPDNYKDDIISLDDLINVVRDDFPSLKFENAKLLVQDLVSKSKADKKILHTNDNTTICLLKIYSAHQNPIGDVDIGIYKLKEKENMLTKKVELLEMDVNNLLEKTKTSLKSGHRNLAKTHLRKKHEVLKRIEIHSKALHNIQVMIEQLHTSQTNELVLESYKQAISSFRHTSAHQNEDEIHDIMDDIHEALKINEDNEAELSRSLTQEDPSLEEELEALMRENVNEEKAEESGIVTAMENLNVISPNVSIQKTNIPAQPIV